MQLNDRELGLAGNSLRLHGQRLISECAEMRKNAKYPADLAVCEILEEQAKEQIALADKIAEGDDE